MPPLTRREKQPLGSFQPATTFWGRRGWNIMTDRMDSMNKRCFCSPAPPDSCFLPCFDNLEAQSQIHAYIKQFYRILLCTTLLMSSYYSSSIASDIYFFNRRLLRALLVSQQNWADADNADIYPAPTNTQPAPPTKWVMRRLRLMNPHWHHHPPSLWFTFGYV